MIGAGRVGTAVAAAWRRAGHDIVGVSGRDATRARVATYLPGVDVVEPARAAAGADLVLLGVPDDRIAPVAADLAGAIGEGTWIAHLSGAAGLDVLDAAGGRRIAIHPLQTFPDVERAAGLLAGCAVAVTADDEEGYALGEVLGHDLGGRPFRLAPEHRTLYHAAAVIGSNDLVALSALATEALERAGVPEAGAALGALQLATLENVTSMGTGAALTGPAVRGDAGTVQKNLEALAAAMPEAVTPYVVLCRVCLDVGTAAGRLDAEGRAGVEEVLARWRR